MKYSRLRIANIDELKPRLINEWARFYQSIVDAAGHISSTNYDTVKQICHTNLKLCYVNSVLDFSLLHANFVTDC